MAKACANLILPYVSLSVCSKNASESVNSFLSIGAEMRSSSKRKGSGGSSNCSINLLSSNAALSAKPDLDSSMYASSSIASSLAAYF